MKSAVKQLRNKRMEILENKNILCHYDELVNKH